jgi:hypothetical protein
LIRISHRTEPHKGSLFQRRGRLLVMRRQQLCILLCPLVGNGERYLPHLMGPLLKVINVHFVILLASAAIASRLRQQ